MSMLPEIADFPVNPLDHVEQVLNDNNWSYDRMNDDQLMVKVTGKSASSCYRLFFTWQENMSALLFGCHYDIEINPKNLNSAAMLLLEINSNLWMGHFEIARDTMAPSFRQTCLLRGQSENAGMDNIHDMVDIALGQCERFRHIFEILAQEEVIAPESLTLALMDTQGES